MVHVIAEIEVRDGTREEFLAEFRRVVPLVRDEDGCLEYGPATDLAMDLSAPERPNVVTVIEKWTSEDALRDHLQAPHMNEYRKRVSAMVAGVSIRIYRPA